MGTGITFRSRPGRATQSAEKMKKSIRKVHSTISLIEVALLGHEAKFYAENPFADYAHMMLCFLHAVATVGFKRKPNSKKDYVVNFFLGIISLYCAMAGSAT